jgi:DNA-binding response OmpR family regulator
LSRACGDEGDRPSQTVKGHISQVRRKLEKYPEKSSHFVSIRGVGYKFVP